MEILLLTSTLMSAFFVGFFLLGYYFGTKAKTNDAYVVKTEEEAKTLKEINDWLNFGGKS